MDRGPIVLREQQQLSENDRLYIQGLGLSFSQEGNFNIPPFLGLSADGWSSYYVGATWLQKGICPLIVHPKIENIDFMSIFANALTDNIAPEYFQDAYSINMEAPFIEDNTLDTVLTPLLVTHFLSVMRPLLAKGLKRNYIIREENLKNKIRGHIMPLRNLQKNILRGHAEKSLCRFQEYSYDYPENRLLKRALLAAESMLLSLKASNNSLLQTVRKYLISFTGISSDISPSAVKSIRKDKLHGEYSEAIKLSKRILKRTDFSIVDKSSYSHTVPEFAVDMSRIFEFHVLGFLHRHFPKKAILFQEPAGIMGRCDYIIPSAKLIVDAKYKSNYTSKDSHILRTDIREVTGYSRSERIRRILEISDHSEIPCLIIYPNERNDTSPQITEGNILSISEPMKGVHNFYTLGISVPVMSL